MVLEATVICVDSSEWMRNGDYFPSRLDAMTEAVDALMQLKFNGNPENTVGILKMSKNPEVLVTPSPRASTGSILSALNAVRTSGVVDLLTSVQVAQLALKHRQNKNQHQRMVLFIGSPLTGTDDKALVRLGRSLKKNNVAVDIISFGEVDQNAEMLKGFIEAVNSSENSHLVTVLPGHALTDAARSLEGYGGASTGGSTSGEFAEMNEDPELLMAIRASLEDERKRQEKEGGGPTPEVKEETMREASAELTEDELLQQALALSLQEASGSSAMETDEPKKESKEHATSASTEQKVEKGESTVEKAALPPAQTATTEQSTGDMISNPEWVKSVLAMLPGVDPNDPQIKSILESYQSANSATDMSEEEETRLAMQMSMTEEESKKGSEKKPDQDKKDGS